MDRHQPHKFSSERTGCRRELREASFYDSPPFRALECERCRAKVRVCVPHEGAVRNRQTCSLPDRLCEPEPIPCDFQICPQPAITPATQLFH